MQTTAPAYAIAAQAAGGSLVFIVVGNDCVFLHLRRVIGGGAADWVWRLRQATSSAPVDPLWLAEQQQVK